MRAPFHVLDTYSSRTKNENEIVNFPMPNQLLQADAKYVLPEQFISRTVAVVSKLTLLPCFDPRVGEFLTAISSRTSMQVVSDPSLATS